MARPQRTHPPRYRPSQSRYETMPYRRCGRSGLKLPAISLGLWHNFGGVDESGEVTREGQVTAKVGAVDGGAKDAAGGQ